MLNECLLGICVEYHIPAQTHPQNIKFVQIGQLEYLL